MYVGIGTEVDISLHHGFIFIILRGNNHDIIEYVLKTHSKFPSCFPQEGQVSTFKSYMLRRMPIC